MIFAKEKRKNLFLKDVNFIKIPSLNYFQNYCVLILLFYFNTLSWWLCFTTHIKAKSLFEHSNLCVYPSHCVFTILTFKNYTYSLKVKNNIVLEICTKVQAPNTSLARWRPIKGYFPNTCYKITKIYPDKSLNTSTNCESNNSRNWLPQISLNLSKL